MKTRVTCIAITVVAIIAIFGFFKIDVEGKNTYFTENTKNAEKEYIVNVRSVLTDNYLPNAGITLTKTSENGVDMEYTMLVHTGLEDNSKIDKEIDKIVLKVKNSTIKIIYS